MSDASIAMGRSGLQGRTALGVLARYGKVIGLATMIVAFSVLPPKAFPTLQNITNVLNQAYLAVIIAGGLTLAVAVGELDLSIGFAASLHGVLVTGLIVTKMRVNSVIGTLGVGTIITGLTFACSTGVPIVAGLPESFLRLSLGRWLFGIPNYIVIMIIVLGLLWLLVERTSLGQEIQAVGGNADLKGRGVGDVSPSNAGAGFEHWERQLARLTRSLLPAGRAGCQYLSIRHELTAACSSFWHCRDAASAHQPC